MFHIHDNDKFNSEEDIIKCMKSMFLDSEYKIEHSWKMCFMHPYQYLEHPVYKEKREDLQKKGHSVIESLGFLLFPAKYGMNSYVPVLNQDFITTLQMSKACPDQTLGKCSDGVSLFKSVDVLLKFAAMKRVKCPRIAVYKFMEGRNRTRLCELDEDVDEIATPDPNFDSFSLDLSFGDDLEARDLKQQLRFSEIFLYDMKTKGEVTVTRSSPRQINPVTMICFLPLRPFIVPRPIVQKPKRKRRLLPKRDASRSATTSHLVGNTSAESECLRTSQCSVCSKSHTYHAETGEALFSEESPCSPVTRASQLSTSSQPAEAQGPAMDVLGQAVFSAGLVDEDPMFCLQSPDQGNDSQASKEPATDANDVDDFLSALQDKSLETLCREVGLDNIICGEETLETPRESEEALMPPQASTQTVAAIPEARTALNDSGSNLSVNIESLSATIQFNSSFQDRIDELLSGQPRPIPECLISATKTTLRRSPRGKKCASVPRGISNGGLKLDLGNVNDGNIFDILNHLLAEKADTQVVEVDQNNNNTRMLCDKTPSNSARVVQQAPSPLPQAQVSFEARPSPNEGRNFVKQPPKSLSRLVLNTPPLRCNVSLPPTPLFLQSDLQALSPSDATSQSSTLKSVDDKESGETEAKSEVTASSPEQPKEIVKRGRGRPKKRGRPAKRKLSEPRKNSESDTKEQWSSDKVSPPRMRLERISPQKQQQPYDYLSSKMLHNAAQKRRAERIDYAKLAKRFSRRIRPEYQKGDRAITQRCADEQQDQARKKRATNAVQLPRSFGHQFLQVVNRRRAVSCVAAVLFDQTPPKHGRLASPKVARTNSFSTPFPSCKQAFTNHKTPPDIAAILDTSPDKEPHNLIAQPNDAVNTIISSVKVRTDNALDLSGDSDDPLLCILSAGDSTGDDAADSRQQHLFSPSPSPSIASRSEKEKMADRVGSLRGQIDFRASFSSSSVYSSTTGEEIANHGVNALHRETENHDNAEGIVSPDGLEIVEENVCHPSDAASKDRESSSFARDKVANPQRDLQSDKCLSPKTSDHLGRHLTLTDIAHGLPGNVHEKPQSDHTAHKTQENPCDGRKIAQGSKSFTQEKCQTTNVAKEAPRRKDNPKSASDSGKVTSCTPEKLLKDAQVERITGDALMTTPKNTQESLSKAPVIQDHVNPPLVFPAPPNNILIQEQQLQSTASSSNQQQQPFLINSSLDGSWRNNSTSSDFGSALSSAGGSTSTVLRKRRKMFHGRPLLMRKYNLPHVIHLESVSHPGAEDPRIAKDLSRVELTRIDPACWQNVDSDFHRFRSAANSSPSYNLGANVSGWSPTCCRNTPDSDSEIDAETNERLPSSKGGETSSLPAEIGHLNNHFTGLSASSKERSERPEIATQLPMSAASKFRVSLLLDAKDADPVFSDDDDHEDVGSFYVCEGDDAIELGASPRDYFPDCSSDDGYSVLTGLGRPKGSAEASKTRIAASKGSQEKADTSAEKLFTLLDENNKLYYDRRDLAREKVNKSSVETPSYRRSESQGPPAVECFKDYVNRYAWLNSCQPSGKMPARPASAHEPYRRASVGGGGGLKGICGFFKNPE